MTRAMRWFLAAVAGTLAGGLYAWAANADVMFTYQGRLEKDAVALEGDHQLRFTLYDGTTALTPVFNFPSVQVVRGEFSVQLGPLTSTMLASTALSIGVEVDGVALAGRQRINAVPYAMRGRGDGVFTVDNKLVVNGVTIGVNDASAGTDRTITFNQYTGDDMNAGKISYGGSFGSGALNIVGGGASPRKITLYDDVNVTNSLNGLKLGPLGHAGWRGIQNVNLTTPDKFMILQSDNGATTIVNTGSGTGNIDMKLANATSIGNFNSSGLQLGSGKWVPTGEENLRIIRGSINLDSNGVPTIRVGTGFTVSRVGARYLISFTNGFNGLPSVTCSAHHPTAGLPTTGTAFCLPLHLNDQTTNQFYAVISAGDNTPVAWGFDFIAVGPR